MTTQSETPSVLHEHMIETPHGRVFVSDVPGEAPPVVLMHGFPDDHRLYDKLVPHLVPRRSVAFDFLGYGRSERTAADNVTLENHLGEIESVLDALAIESAVLVGHDGSGPDAVVYALTNPHRVAHLVLLNTVFGNRPSLHMPEMTRLFSDPDLKSLTDDLVADPNQLLWLLMRWGVQFDLDAGGADSIVRTSILAQFVGDEQQSDALESIRAWTAGWRASLDQQDELVESGAVAGLDVPVTLIWGEDDPYTSSAVATETAELFPNATVHFVPGVGHYPQHDRAVEVADILNARL